MSCVNKATPHGIMTIDLPFRADPTLRDFGPSTSDPARANSIRTSADPTNLVEQALPRARKLKVDAVETVLRAHYPRVCRIAMALCAREKSAKAAIRSVLRQSFKPMRFWANESEAANWFLHHTVLTAREHVGLLPDPGEDCLVEILKKPSTEHIAFMRALRQLTEQQREAFLLFRAEHLDPRRVGVAMDCSTGAADTHRIAAENALSTVAGKTYDARVAEVMRVYATLTPPEDLVIGDVSSALGKVNGSRFTRTVRFIFQLIILGAIGWFVWRLSQMIVI
jgi:DNA-directed RNA polymerase specialized sigma24 family protein